MANRRAELHELLAVEPDLEKVANKVLEEAIVVFTKKTDFFVGRHKTLRMFDDARTNEQIGADEFSPIVTTVIDKLNYVWKNLTRLYDTSLQKERTNQDARADLVVNGEIMGEDLPATWLLGMERRLARVRDDLCAKIPTHDPALEWEPDPEKGDNIYRAKHLVVKDRTEKQKTHKAIFQPTEHQAGQYESWDENVKVGVFETQYWTSAISPARKSRLLEKLDDVIRACKKARTRANKAEIVKVHVAKKIFDYVNG
jgi:hypothetical protein